LFNSGEGLYKVKGRYPPVRYFSFQVSTVVGDAWVTNYGVTERIAGCHSLLSALRCTF